MSEEDYKVINVSEKAFQDFKLISQHKFFKGLETKQLFILAMSLGVRHNKYQKPLGEEKRHSGGYTRVEYLSDEDKDLIKAIAIAKAEDVNILNNQKEQYQIAETYAEGGIKILKDLISSPGDFLYKFDSELKSLNSKDDE